MDRYWASFTTAQLREELKHVEESSDEAQCEGDAYIFYALEKTALQLKDEIAQRERAEQ